MLPPAAPVDVAWKFWPVTLTPKMVTSRLVGMKVYPDFRRYRVWAGLKSRQCVVARRVGGGIGTKGW